MSRVYACLAVSSDFSSLDCDYILSLAKTMSNKVLFLWVQAGAGGSVLVKDAIRYRIHR